SRIVAAISGKHIPRVPEEFDCLGIAAHRTARYVVEGHCPPLSRNSSHHSRSWHDVLFNTPAVQAPTDPDVIHIKRTWRRSGIIPKRRIKETRLNQITCGTCNHGHTFRFSNLISSKHFRHEPDEIVWHQRTPKTKRRFR